MKLNDCIVIIPARKNSKRIIGKNLRLLDGKPLISHSIEYALNFVDQKHIWVNTDDEKVIDLANKYGVSSYNRPAKLALDETSTNEVVNDFSKYLKLNNINYNYLITLQPTNPIRSINLINDALDCIKSKETNSLMSVSILHKKFGRISNNKYLPMNYKIGQRHQDLENLYFENGLIYISTKDALSKEEEYITSDVYPFITDEIGSFVDIDYEDDLKFAELIIKTYKI